MALYGQQEDNPFDLTHRLPEKSEAKTNENLPENQNPFDLSHRISNAANSELSDEKGNENPFDIIHKNTEENNAKEKEPEKIKKEADTIAKGQNNDYVFWFMLFLLVYLALLITIYKNLIIKIYRAFTNDNILKLLHREQGNLISFPYLLLYFLFFISGGAFIFFAFHYFGYISLLQRLLYYSIIGVAGFFLVKHIILIVIQIIFPVQKEIKIYSFSIIIFNIILGLCLIPFNIIAAFANPDVITMGIYGGLGIILAIYLFHFLRGLFIASKYITFHKFHFFMYICTVEIAPVLILVKILMNSAGIH